MLKEILEQNIKQFTPEQIKRLKKEVENYAKAKCEVEYDDTSYNKVIFIFKNEVEMLRVALPYCKIKKLDTYGKTADNKFYLVLKF